MTKNIAVFVEFRNLARILALYNSEHFQVLDRKTWWRNFWSALLFMVFLILMMVLYTAAVIHCFDCKFAIGETAFAIPTSFVILQVFSVYVSMAWNNRQISEAIDHLQQVIDAGEIDSINLTAVLIYFHLL